MNGDERAKAVLALAALVFFFILVGDGGGAGNEVEYREYMATLDAQPTPPWWPTIPPELWPADWPTLTPTPTNTPASRSRRP